MNPGGRAFLRAAAYQPPHEPTSQDYPLQLTTGRTAYHFHTRTKTGRARQLDAAAPSAWVEVSAGDAGRLGLNEGDIVSVSSVRGELEAPVRIGHGRDGVVFIPFYYGGNGSRTAANELTPAAHRPDRADGCHGTFLRQQPRHGGRSVQPRSWSPTRSPAPAEWRVLRPAARRWPAVRPAVPARTGACLRCRVVCSRDWYSQVAEHAQRRRAHDLAAAGPKYPPHVYPVGSALFMAPGPAATMLR